VVVVHEGPVGVHDVDDPRDVTGEAGGVGTEERLEEETVRAPKSRLGIAIGSFTDKGRKDAA
jgi:hypothetical protein